MTNQSEYTKLFDIMAERSLLGACLIDPTAIDRVAGIVTPESFYREENQAIFTAMMNLTDNRAPVDIVTLMEELTRIGRLDDVSDIYSLAAEVPSALHVQHYAQIVADKATMRSLNNAATEIVQTVFSDNVTAQEALDTADRIISTVTSGKSSKTMEHIGPLLERVIKELDEQNPAGVPTGFSILDRMLGGLQRGDLVILAARPGMGKSSLALSIADNVAKSGKRVAIFSLEMSKEQFTQRHLSMRTGIDSHRIKMRNIHDDEWPIILEAANDIRQCDMHIDDIAALWGFDSLRREARKLHKEKPLDLLVVDYLQLMSGKGNNREQEVAYISRNLSLLAKELNVPVLCLSQLNRAVESRADKRPMLSDLRDTGAIEQDAAVVMFIYREDYYIEDTDRQNIADIIIAKHRHGALGTVGLFFRKELTQFRDLEINRTELP